jgi:hypothetical protein
MQTGLQSHATLAFTLLAVVCGVRLAAGFCVFKGPSRHVPRFLLGHLVLIGTAITLAAQAEEIEDKMLVQTRECTWVVLGRISEISSIKKSSNGTVLVGAIEVNRYLKGNPGENTVPVEFQYASSINLQPETENRIWFFRSKLENGRYLITDWRWNKEDTYRVLECIWKLDKTSGIPGMPKPFPGTQPITVSLAFDDGRGHAITSKETVSPHGALFLIQFENVHSKSCSVMPCLDGSVMRSRYPYYEFEIVDIAGKPVAQQGWACCGNVNPFHKDDFVSLAPGEIFRTPASAPWPELAPGKYKIRLRYTAKRDLNITGSPLGKNDKEVRQLLRNVWEGTVESNWVDLEVHSDEKKQENGRDTQTRTHTQG